MHFVGSVRFDALTKKDLVTMNDWREVWQRLQRGGHAVVFSKGPFPLPDAGELRLLTVDGAASSAPLEMLDTACALLRPLQRTGAPALLDAAAEKLRASLRHRLLGEPERSAALERYQLLTRPIVEAGAPPIALLLRSVDRADEASLQVLGRLLEQGTEPRLPLLFCFDSREPSAPAQRLLEQLQRSLPREAFWSPSPEPLPSPATPSSTKPAELPPMTPALLRMLRAAAAVGDRFESAVIAQLLGIDELEVLAALQEAVDRGLPIEDRGSGIFRLQPSLGSRLRKDTLPSLARAWHERLAQLFGGLPAPLADGAAIAPSPGEPAARAAAPPVNPEPIQPEPVAGPATESAARELLTPGGDPRVEWRDPRPSEWWQRLERELAPGQTAETEPSADESARPAEPPAADASPVPGPAPAPDEQRAASHAEAAGMWVTACAQHLAAAQRAALSGLHHRAQEHAAQALALAANLPDREERRSVQVTALMIAGRARWQCAPDDEQATLNLALATLADCRQLIQDSDPAPLRAELAALMAHVQYDIGSPAALEAALRELTFASQLMLDAGRPMDAARLLNDEAAVWVKLGDPVRAHYLLSRSREVFSKVVASHPAAGLELAETEHLLARLLLQAPARPGRERDAWQLGVEHARAAEEAYRAIADQQSLGRVWETLARLQLRLGRFDDCARQLEDARALQQQLGDGVGLARSNAAAADLLFSRHDYARALERLADSVRLNAEKGLRAGLEANRARLRQLGEELPDLFQDARRALEQRVESALGRAALVLG